MSVPDLPAERWRGAAHVFVDDLDAPEPDASDRHHLERVLRLRAGELLTASDGRGRWRWVRAGSPLAPLGAVITEARPRPALTVGFALLKGDRNELVVQKLTELGIDAIAPFAAERSVVRWDGDRSGRHGERLSRVAREAAMQCRRVWLPTVEPVRAFRDVATGEAALASIDGGPPTLGRPTLLVGPEGGWSDTEHASCAHKVRLAEHVLRGETAAITAGVILAAMRSGLVVPYAT